MDLELAGRRALVTGGSRGIGKAIVTTLAREGAQVIFCGRFAGAGNALVAELADEGITVEFFIADTETDEGVDALALQALAGGTIDILVNNVGGASNPEGAGRGFSATPSGDWANTYYKCVVGAVRLINHLVPAMREQGWGRIINISATAGLEPPDDTPAEYAAAKAGTNTMTMSLSRHLSQTGVTVNAVTPGPILTEGLQAWMEGMAAARGWGDDPKVQEQMFLKEVLPLTVKRLGQPNDIAAMVAFIASTQADFITGSNIRIDGGLSRSAI